MRDDNEAVDAVATVVNVVAAVVDAVAAVVDAVAARERRGAATGTTTRSHDGSCRPFPLDDSTGRSPTPSFQLERREEVAVGNDRARLKPR